jgi:predicted P-loop ATPase
MSERQKQYNTQSKEALHYYLSSLFPPESGYIELRPFSDQDDLFPHKYNCRRWYKSVEDLIGKIPSICKYLLDKRNGTFIGLVPRTEYGKGTKEFIESGYAIWSDIDDKDTGSRANTLNNIASLKLAPSCVVESGGGCHVYYFLNHPATGPEIEAANKLFIKATNGDKAASDCTRILRLPQSYHCKGDPILVEFREINNTKYSLEDCVEALGGSNLFNLEMEKDNKKNPVKKITIKPKNQLSPAIDDLMILYPRLEALYNGIGKESGGQSPSEYDYSFVKELLWYGATESDTVHALQSRIIADNRKKPPHYIQRTVGKAAADVYRRKGGGKKADLKLVPPPDIAPLQLEIYPEDYSNKMMRGRPVATLVNLLAIMRQRASGSDRIIRYNSFKSEIELYGKKIEDYKSTKLMEAIFVANRQEWSSDMFARCLEAIAREYSYHPVQEHLKKCHRIWVRDGKKERIKDVFSKYCNTSVTYKKLMTNAAGIEIEDDICKLLLLKEISRCFFVGSVARIFEAGCKMETTLILKGDQGCGKSTFFKLLASNRDYKNVGELINDSPSWFCDSMLDPTGGRDTYSKLGGVWLYEFAELAATRKKEAEAIKAFLSSGKDKYSPKYARYDVEQKRQVVFVGTTNELEILRDLTGNRRFHVLEVGNVDLAGLLEIRDLLWGEAYSMYLANDGYHLPADLQAELDGVQAKFKASDSWSDALIDWLKQPNIATGEHTTQEILSGAIKMDTEKQNRAVTMRMAGILSATGWTKKRATAGKKRVWKWIAPTNEVK